jgi:heterodisulfide reductase subunit A
LDTDLVVLATGIVPSESTKEVCDLLKIPQSEDGFFLEVHPKLRPIETVVDGVFIVGCCHSPRDIPDSIAQACGAAALAAGILSKEEIEIEPIFAVIEDEICNGCRICEGVCEYGALSLDEGKMGVNEMICKGCGLCESTCPSGAISVSAYNDSQILAEIEAML